MKNLLPCLLSLSLVLSAHAAQPPTLTAFVDVNVVPMDADRVLPRQTVVVRGNVIEAMGPVADTPVPADARRIEGGGTAWLLPGLADMHTHVNTAEDATVYLASGVTTVLHLGGPTRLPALGLRAATVNGESLSPQIYFSFMVDGTQPFNGGWPIRSAEDARALMPMVKGAGYDFIKVYGGLTAEAYDAVVAEAAKQRMAVIGHGVHSVGLPASLFKGQIMVAHMEEFYYTTFAYKVDDSRIAAVADETARSGAYVTPTLITFEVIARQWGNPDVLDAYWNDPRVEYVSLNALNDWTTRDYTRNPGDMMTPLAFLKRMTKAMSDRNVPLLAGTDSPVIPGLLPGHALNEELRALMEAGLTRYQALSAATRTPGEFIAKYVPDAQRFGVVQSGYRADLLLVATNPLQAIDTLKAPLGVMHAGQWRSRSDLDAALEAVKKKYARAHRARSR